MTNRKIEKFLERRYIAAGKVMNLTFLFSVPKGEDDIRIVWDSSGNGVNTTLWTPSFGISTVRTLTWYIVAGTNMGDFDIGECWHTRLLTPDEESGVYVLESDYQQEPGQRPTSNLQAVPRLLLDVRPIRAILSGPTPIMRILRTRSSVNVFYGFGDASGEGYGKAMRKAGRRGRIDFEYGFWCSEISEESSNFREFRNFLLWIHRGVREGWLRRAQLFLFSRTTRSRRAFSPEAHHLLGNCMIWFWKCDNWSWRVT
jgi:hypothetical protein